MTAPAVAPGTNMARPPYIANCDRRCGHCPAWDFCGAYSYERDSGGMECSGDEEEARAEKARRRARRDAVAARAEDARHRSAVQSSERSRVVRLLQHLGWSVPSGLAECGARYVGEPVSYGPCVRLDGHADECFGRSPLGRWGRWHDSKSTTQEHG